MIRVSYSYSTRSLPNQLRLSYRSARRAPRPSLFRPLFSFPSAFRALAFGYDRFLGRFPFRKIRSSSSLHCYFRRSRVKCRTWTFYGARSRVARGTVDSLLNNFFDFVEIGASWCPYIFVRLPENVNKIKNK